MQHSTARHMHGKLIFYRIYWLIVVSDNKKNAATTKAQDK